MVVVVGATVVVAFIMMHCVTGHAVSMQLAQRQENVSCHYGGLCSLPCFSSKDDWATQTAEYVPAWTLCHGNSCAVAQGTVDSRHVLTFHVTEVHGKVYLCVISKQGQVVSIDTVTAVIDCESEMK